MTRRQALVTGATAGLVAMLGGPSAAARAAGGGPPAWLRRAGYAPLVGDTFTVGGQPLKLTAVADLAGAAATPALRGHDGAFALTFTGPAGALDSGVHEFEHPALGRFTLFAGPVDRADGDRQDYEVTIDRSVAIPETSPEPGDPRPGAAPDAGLVAEAEAPVAEGEAAAPAAAPAKAKAKTKATKKSTRKPKRKKAKPARRRAKRTTSARRRKAKTRRR
jgi:hypothetical protein